MPHFEYRIGVIMKIMTSAGASDLSPVVLSPDYFIKHSLSIRACTLFFSVIVNDFLDILPSTIQREK